MNTTPANHVSPPKSLYYGDGLPAGPTDGWPGALIVIEGTDGTGRTTQIASLREWLGVQGYATVETGWSRSKLLGETISDAKKGHTLTRLTYTLMYATDFADRLEYEILPALRSGWIVLADRYIFTAIARSVVRGVHPQWLRNLFGFAPRPDLSFYLKTSVEDLIPRVLRAGKMNYWESGMDLNLGEDLYESFRIYQGKLIHELDQMAEEFEFISMDANVPPDVLQSQLRQKIGEFLQKKYNRAVDEELSRTVELPQASTLAAEAKKRAVQRRQLLSQQLSSVKRNG